MLNFKRLASGTALAAALMIPLVAGAETIKQKVVTTPQTLENTVSVDFSSFDTNKNNILSKAEVGEKLFELFDRDGNGLIDNDEFDKKNVYTIQPFEQETFTMVDYDDDGVTDHTSYKYDEFLKKTHLSRFDKNIDGLSPQEFVDKNFYDVDTDGNKLIEKDEWKTTYTSFAGLPEDKRLETYLNN